MTEFKSIGIKISKQAEIFRFTAENIPFKTLTAVTNLREQIPLISDTVDLTQSAGWFVGSWQGESGAVLAIAASMEEDELHATPYFLPRHGTPVRVNRVMGHSEDMEVVSAFAILGPSDDEEEELFFTADAAEWLQLHYALVSNPPLEISAHFSLLTDSFTLLSPDASNAFIPVGSLHEEFLLNPDEVLPTSETKIAGTVQDLTFHERSSSNEEFTVATVLPQDGFSISVCWAGSAAPTLGEKIEATGSLKISFDELRL